MLGLDHNVWLFIRRVVKSHQAAQYTDERPRSGHENREEGNGTVKGSHNPADGTEVNPGASLELPFSKCYPMDPDPDPNSHSNTHPKLTKGARRPR